MARAAAVNDDPRFLDTMADAVAATWQRYAHGCALPIVSAAPPERHRRTAAASRQSMLDNASAPSRMRAQSVALSSNGASLRGELQHSTHG